MWSTSTSSNAKETSRKHLAKSSPVSDVQKRSNMSNWRNVCRAWAHICGPWWSTQEQANPNQPCVTHTYHALFLVGKGTLGAWGSSSGCNCCERPAKTWHWGTLRVCCHRTESAEEQLPTSCSNHSPTPPRAPFACTVSGVKHAARVAAQLLPSTATTSRRCWCWNLVLSSSILKLSWSVACLAPASAHHLAKGAYAPHPISSTMASSPNLCAKFRMR